ncbi:MAG: AI-2E family transporter [Anaerovoracaceae bacterium]
MENFFIDLAAGLWTLISPLLTALSPLLTGLILAYLLSPAVEWFGKRTGRKLAILLTYLILLTALIGLLYGFIVLILGALPTGGIRETAEIVRIYFEEAYETAAAFVGRFLPEDLMAAEDAADSLQRWAIRRFSAESVTGFLSAVSGGVISLFLGVIVSVYLLKDKEFFLLLWTQFLSLVLKQKLHGQICEIMDEINRVITAFLKGALVDSLLVAFLSSVVLAVVGVDFAVVLGLLMGVLNIIPYFGPFIGMVPAFLTAFFDGGLTKAIAAILGLFLIQQIDGDLIYPHIVGNTTGLHPLFVLLAVSIFGYCFGLPGMIAAVPAAGILQILIRRWVFR